MKKVMMLVLTLIFTLPTFASGNSWESKGKESQKRQAPTRGAEDDEGYLVFGYCLGYANAVGQVGTLKAAIQVPDETAAELSGSQLTQVKIGFGTASSSKVTVYLSETLTSTPFYTQDVTLPVMNGWNVVKLDVPYEVTDKGFFIGYEYKNCRQGEYPIGVDEVITDNPYGDNVWANGWDHIGSMFGSVCVQGVFEGDNLPQNDVDIINVSVPFSVKPSSPFTVSAVIVNQGSNSIQDVGFDVMLDGKNVENVSCVLPEGKIAPGEFAEVEVSGITAEKEMTDLPISLILSKVNGVSNSNQANREATVYTACFNNGVKRNMVVEEWTGTWCGWCVRGIVGMDYMEKTYGDKGFIGIAVHSGDRMEVASYGDFLNTWAIIGFPGCAINRSIETDPNMEDLENYFKEVTANQTYVDVTEIKAEYSNEDPRNLKVSAEVEFTAPVENGDYRIAFVVKENQVGPYGQSNYYAGSGVDMDGWQNYSENRMWLFDDVARRITDCNGIPGSIPADVEKNTKVNYATTMQISNVTKLSNCKLVAMVLNNRSGEIVNASSISLYETGVSEIEESAVRISAERGGILVEGEITECSVYDMGGRFVGNAAAEKLIPVGSGVYVVRLTTADGNIMTRKVVVK